MSGKKSKGFSWLGGCGFLLLGSLIGIVGITLLAFFWLSSPVSNQPLPRRDFTGTADVAATASEPYLNSAITRYLKANPISLSGIVNIKDITLQIQPEQQIAVALRVGNDLGDFNLTVTEAVAVQNGKIVLKPVGQPQVGKGNLPIPADQVVALANTLLIEPEINRNLAQIQVATYKFRLVDLTTAAGLITVKFNAQ